MNKKWFCISAGIILAVTGSAKIWSSFSGARIFKNADPFLGLSFGHLIFVAGILELAIAGICLFKRTQILATISVAWLSTNLLLYRFGLWWKNWRHPCGCLGNLTDALHIPPQTADIAMKIIMAYLLIGSYGILFHFWWKRKAEGGMQNDEIKPVGNSKIEVGS